MESDWYYSSTCSTEEPARASAEIFEQDNLDFSSWEMSWTSRFQAEHYVDT